MSDPLSFLLDELPGIFAQIRAALQTRVEVGDKRAVTRAADIDAAHVATRIDLVGEGGGQVFLISESGAFRVSRDKPDDPPLRHVLSVSVEAAQRALAWFMRTPLDQARLERKASEAPGLPSARTDQLFAKYKFAFDFQILDVPELGDVAVRLSLGKDLPSAPEFTIRTRFADLKNARERGTGPQELFASGKLGLSGDVAKAMMFAMTLTQLR